MVPLLLSFIAYVLEGGTQEENKEPLGVRVSDFTGTHVRFKSCLFLFHLRPIVGPPCPPSPQQTLPSQNICISESLSASLKGLYGCLICLKRPWQAPWGLNVNLFHLCVARACIQCLTQSRCSINICQMHIWMNEYMVGCIKPCACFVSSTALEGIWGQRPMS